MTSHKELMQEELNYYHHCLKAQLKYLYQFWSITLRAPDNIENAIKRQANSIRFIERNDKLE